MSEKVFLSYAAPNFEIVRLLAEFLKKSGVEIWFDDTKLEIGDRFDDLIRAEISSSELFIACLSAESEEWDGYFNSEMDYARKAKTPDKKFIIPVLLNPCRIPSVLDDLIFFELFKLGPRSLLRSISKALGSKNQLPDPWAEKALVRALRDATPGVLVTPSISIEAEFLLDEIRSDKHLGEKGVSLFTRNQVKYLPYLWDGDVHGDADISKLPKFAIKKAIDELVDKGILHQVLSGKSLSQWALHIKADHRD